MKIKSLLLGSAAALVAVSSAQAADAVVIPEPEAVEYVRVCDAAGTGYFYIPGSETCLRISGYVRYEIAGQNSNWDGDALADVTIPGFAEDPFDSEGWDKDTEARVLFQSWTDSEYGAVTANIRLDGNIINEEGSSSNLAIDRAFLTVGGLNMGLDTNLYDFDQDGAADDLVANGEDRNQISYTVDFGSGSFALQLLEDNNDNYVPNVIARVDVAAGDLGVTAAVAYDDDDAAGNSSWGAKVAATYAGFGAHVAYTSDTANAFAVTGGGGDYSAQYTWVLAANYSFDATEKLNINAAVAYGIDHAGGTAFDTNDNDFVVGLEAEYALTDTFTVSSRVRWLEDVNTSPVDDFDIDGFDWRMRFTSSF